MKVERQGTMECALCAIGALTETPLAVVRQRAETIAAEEFGGIPWHRNKVLQRVAETFDVAPLVGICSTGWPQFPYRRRTLPLRGRGTVLATKKRLNTGHAAPWENGVVYDPINPVPQTLAEFRRSYRRYAIFVFGETL